MTAYTTLQAHLKQHSSTWLVTGVAGFIGSNLLETLLTLNQQVRGLDNFSSGHRHNLEQVRARVTAGQWDNFQLIEADVCHLEKCRSACHSVDYVLHQAAVGSVPRSIEDPVYTNNTNIGGFLNMLLAAKDAKVKRFVYASSSAVYGDEASLPKQEQTIGQPLSPYAVTKYVNELYCGVFARCYDFKTIGLRYFNIFGQRQDPEGAYAAVMPKWVASMLTDQPVFINGDGETSRDFCYVDNAVQANLLAATTHREDALDQVYNVAVHERTTLNQLFATMRELLALKFPQVGDCQPHYRDFRTGDVRHSLADISKAKDLLGYVPTHRIADGMRVALDWYVNDLARDIRFKDAVSHIG